MSFTMQNVEQTKFQDAGGMDPGPKSESSKAVEENESVGVDNHYENLCNEKYLRIPFYHNADFIRWQTECIRKALDLKKDDILADIGCGPGKFAILFEQFVDSPIHCVEPFMEVKAHPKLKQFKLSAVDYLKSNQPTKI